MHVYADVCICARLGYSRNRGIHQPHTDNHNFIEKILFFNFLCKKNLVWEESGKLVWCAQTTATHIGHSEREEANAEYGSHGVLGTRSLAYFIISIFAIRIIMNIFTTSRAAIIFCARQRQRRQRKMHNHNKGCFIRVRSPCARVCEWASAYAPNVCERSQTNVYTSHTRTPNSHSQLATRIHTHTRTHGRVPLFSYGVHFLIGCRAEQLLYFPEYVCLAVNRVVY